MHYRIVTTLAFTTLLLARSAGAQTPAKPLGTLVLGDRQFKLAHVVAYPTTSSDETLVTVLASDRKLPIDRIKQVLKDNEQSDEDLSLTQPYLKLVYNQAGELQQCHAWADNSSFSAGGSDVEGKATLTASRASGTATLPNKEDALFVRSFTLTFDVPLGLHVTPASTAPDKPVKPTVSGKYIGNGKAAKLAFVSAYASAPFNDQPGFTLVLTEKDHSRDPKPDFKAGFGEYGSALIIQFHDDGSIYGCQIAHSGLEKKGFSSIGTTRMDEFDIGERHVQGHLSTNGEQDFFDDKWEIDLTFAAPLAAKAKPASPGKPAAAATTTKPAKPAKPADKPMPRATSSATLQARKLPLPENATDVAFKGLVKQLTFNSPDKIAALAADFSKRLAAQGWKPMGPDLVNANTAILRRQQGEATMTIMVKPSASGSQVTIFATGLNWDE